MALRSVKVTQLENKLKALQSELNALKAEEDVKRFPNSDPHQNGTIIKWVRQFNSGETIYTYIALRVNNAWYVTGDPQTYDWKSLVSKHLNNALYDEYFSLTTTYTFNKR